MLIHWHTEAPEDHLLTRFVHACLAGAYGGPQHRQAGLHSWETGGRVAYAQFPGGRPGDAASPVALSDAARPDLRLYLRPEADTGAAVYAAGATAGAEHLMLRWGWATPPQAAEPSEARFVFPPHLPEIRFRGQSPGPSVMGLALDSPLTAEEDRWRKIAGLVRAQLPDLEVRALLDAAAYGRRWDDWLHEADPAAYPRVISADLRDCGMVLFASGALEWAPLLLLSMLEEREVLVPMGSPCAALAAGERGVCYAGTTAEQIADAVIQLVHRREGDPEQREARLRRAGAWVRRWSPERAGLQLLDTALSFAGQSELRERPVQWRLRREIGIGDVVFTLSVAQALKQRDPTCEVTVHTLPQHAEWVSWFPVVDRVTTGDFDPTPGAHVGDFETNFPSASPVDRTLALGSVIGIHPHRWVDRPRIPPEVLNRVAPLLAARSGPRILFAPASKGRHSTRTLPQAVASETSKLLSTLGNVYWLDEIPADGVPDGINDLSGKLSLEDLLGLLQQCDLCVAVDSGILHLAVSVGKPVVGLFTHIGALQRLWLAPRFVALQPSLPCAPCGEGLDAWHCRKGQAAMEAPPLLCASLLIPGVIRSAAERALEFNGREVWNLAPDGTHLVWDVDELPVPFALPNSTNSQSRSPLRVL